jgi:transcriptional regulator with XRE-family HTH domain
MMEFPKDNILDNWLEANQNPEIDRFIDKNLAITEKVATILKEKGIKKKEFAKMLGKSPSEVSKWLTGLHNLTLKSITKMEEALGVNLINIEPEIEYKYVYLGSISGKPINQAINDYEESMVESMAM